MKLTKQDWDKIYKLHCQSTETCLCYKHNNCAVKIFFGQETILVVLTYDAKDARAEFRAEPLVDAGLTFTGLINTLDKLSDFIIATQEPRLRLVSDDIYDMYFS